MSLSAGTKLNITYDTFFALLPRTHVIVTQNTPISLDRARARYRASIKLLPHTLSAVSSTDDDAHVTAATVAAGGNRSSSADGKSADRGGNNTAVVGNELLLSVPRSLPSPAVSATAAASSDLLAHEAGATLAPMVVDDGASAEGVAVTGEASLVYPRTENTPPAAVLATEGGRGGRVDVVPHMEDNADEPTLVVIGDAESAVRAENLSPTTAASSDGARVKGATAEEASQAVRMEMDDPEPPSNRVLPSSSLTQLSPADRPSPAVAITAEMPPTVDSTVTVGASTGVAEPTARVETSVLAQLAGGSSAGVASSKTTYASDMTTAATALLSSSGSAPQKDGARVTGTQASRPAPGLAGVVTHQDASRRGGGARLPSGPEIFPPPPEVVIDMGGEQHGDRGSGGGAMDRLYGEHCRERETAARAFFEEQDVLRRRFQSAVDLVELEKAVECAGLEPRNGCRTVQTIKMRLKTRWREGTVLPNGGGGISRCTSKEAQQATLRWKEQIRAAIADHKEMLRDMLGRQRLEAGALQMAQEMEVKKEGAPRLKVRFAFPMIFDEVREVFV